jgi:antitoxin (DNA-binding transcriptional repressor) of toxin-antitoxin stability system
MASQTVGIREFRENLASYLESDKPVTITRHGDTVGIHNPGPRRKPTPEDWARLRESTVRVQRMLAEAGVTEEEVIADYEKLRAEEKRRRRAGEAEYATS